MKEKFPEVQEILKEVEYYKSLLKKRSLDQMVWIITSNQDAIKKAAKRYSLYDQFILLNIGQLLIKSQEFSKEIKRLSTIWNFNKYIEAVMKSGSTSSLKPSKTYNLKGIIIKTVHSVKGGEFDVVFLLIKEAEVFL